MTTEKIITCPNYNGWNEKNGCTWAQWYQTGFVGING